MKCVTMNADTIADNIRREVRCVCGVLKDPAVSVSFCVEHHFLLPLEMRAALKEPKSANDYINDFMSAQRIILDFQALGIGFLAKGATA